MRVIEGDTWSLDYSSHGTWGRPQLVCGKDSLHVGLIIPGPASKLGTHIFHISCHVVRPVDSEASLAQLNNLHMKTSQVTIDELLKQPWFLNEWQAARDKLSGLSFQSARLLCTWAA